MTHLSVCRKCLRLGKAFQSPSRHRIRTARVGGGSGKITGCGGYSSGISWILHQGNGGNGDLMVKSLLDKTTDNPIPALHS